MGLGTARYENYLKRRETHLREHKENFVVIQEALDSLKAEVFQLTAKGTDDLRLPRWKEPPFKRQLERWSLFEYQRVEPMGADMSGPFVVTRVDDVLYSDIAKHFPDLTNRLARIEKVVTSEGVQLDQLLWEVSRSIYEAMASSELSVLKWGFSEGKRATLRDIASADTNEAQSYAGILYLLLTREGPGSWPNTYAQLQEYDLVKGLQQLADVMRSNFGADVSKLISLRNGIFTEIDSCGSSIGQLRRNTKMKGNCDYL